jgi:hypothetical protein
MLGRRHPAVKARIDTMSLVLSPPVSYDPSGGERFAEEAPVGKLSYDAGHMSGTQEWKLNEEWRVKATGGREVWRRLAHPDPELEDEHGESRRVLRFSKPCVKTVSYTAADGAQATFTHSKAASAMQVHAYRRGNYSFEIFHCAGAV